MGESGGSSRWSRVPGARYAQALLAGVLAATVLLGIPSGASALTLKPCRTDVNFGCGSVRVPLDHAGRAPGTISVAVAAQRRYPKNAGLLIALSGGPGQSGVDFADSFAYSLAPLLRRNRLVVIDQRGTGLSGALSCPEIQRLDGLQEYSPQAILRCAKQIGPRRAFYRTADTVEDLDAVRRAFGARKVTLMGVSYGTWVAQEYARAHPRSVESLVLDSVVGPDATDAFGLEGFRRLPRVLREQCAKGRCKGATNDIVGDLGKVASKLRRGPLRAPVFDAAGRARTRSLDAEDQLHFLVTSADINPFMQARIPGALGSAVRGDLGPLLRLRRIAAGPPSTSRELSFGLNATTLCLDAQLPFSLASEPAERRPLADAAARAVSPALYAPWSEQTLRATSYADDCLLWPRDDRPRLPTKDLPDVRTLLLAGRLDMRTPLEDAVRVQRLLPRSELVTVPGNGHDQVDTDGTGCVERALGRWVARRPVGRPCAGKTNQLTPLPRAPLRLSEFPAPGRIPGDRGRALLATLDTVEDARFSALEAVYAGYKPTGGGLRGGSFSSTDAFQGTMRLRGYSYVPGVRVSGRLEVDGERVSGRVTVTGRYTGTLDLRSTEAASGTLGGRSVSYARAGAAGAAAVTTGGFPQIPSGLLDPRAVPRRSAAR